MGKKNKTWNVKEDTVYICSSVPRALYVYSLYSFFYVQTYAIVQVTVITLFLLVLPASSIKKQIVGSKTCC